MLAGASWSPTLGIVMLLKLGQSDPTSTALRKGIDASEAIRLSARDLNIE